MEVEVSEVTVSRTREGDVTTFLRKKDYRLIRELGHGACGKTVLLFDEQIDEYFVCKKYQPFSESQRETLFKNFVGEIKLLHQLHHANVVRVFNYYLYPESLAGYILMEFVDGSDIEEFVKVHPEQCNELFVQAISGFAYLERSGILHRDIRPMNLLVSREGRLKIIDLGFGKRVRVTADFAKSITLNWWCAPQRIRRGAVRLRDGGLFRRQAVRAGSAGEWYQSLQVHGRAGEYVSARALRKDSQLRSGGDDYSKRPVLRNWI
jgi:serine/threonine protein kinase